MASFPAFPVKYLALRGESGWRLLIHDIVPTGIATVMLSAPFLIFNTTNYFHKDGFLDKFGTFSSVLTGFYVAGLVAVATFSMQSSALDEKIENGPVFLWEKEQDAEAPATDLQRYVVVKRKLSRREYLCQMFGYLATVSMFLTLLTIVATIVAQTVKMPSVVVITKSRYIPLDILRSLAIIGFSVPISHLVATTGRGLFYLVDRLYDRKPKILPKP